MSKEQRDPSELSDKIQLAIRDEVEKRVEHRENTYWKFGGLFVAVVVVFFALLWRAQLSEIRTIVAKELSEQEVIKAKDRIMAIKSNSEDIDRHLNDISTSMNTNQQWFMERLNQIKQQDNVVLMEDLSKLFVFQTVTNLVDGRKIILNYDPVPGTVEFIFKNSDHSILLGRLGHLEGKAIVFRDEPDNGMRNFILNRELEVKYIRKSVH